MAKKERDSKNWPRSLMDLSRTRRARLVAEFEQELGIDHRARLDAAARKKRWMRIKSIIVWTIALTLFSFACWRLWEMGQRVERPFADVNPVGDLIRR